MDRKYSSTGKTRTPFIGRNSPQPAIQNKNSAPPAARQIHSTKSWIIIIIPPVEEQSGLHQMSAVVFAIQISNKDPLIGGFKFSSADRDELIAFLRTLTDDTVIRDKKFAESRAARN
jgi:hypothetical protein